MQGVTRGWRFVCAVLVVVIGFSLVGASVAAQPGGKGKPGGGGASCPDGSAQVVLDPGHGGSDPGAVANGIVEAELTLDIALRVAAQLGYSTQLTRDSNGTTLGNSERGDIANDCGALVYVSIHFNASSNPEVNYTQTFWGKKRKDLDFAAWMSGYMTLGIPNNGAGQFANGALLTASMPATLIESAFITNPGEAQQLSDPSSGRRDRIAAAIAVGINDWLAAQGY